MKMSPLFVPHYSLTVSAAVLGVEGVQGGETSFKLLNLESTVLHFSKFIKARVILDWNILFLMMEEFF